MGSQGPFPWLLLLGILVLVLVFSGVVVAAVALLGR
jgi:hypothetical protein